MCMCVYVSVCVGLLVKVGKSRAVCSLVSSRAGVFGSTTDV